MNRPQKVSDVLGEDLKNWKIGTGYFLESSGLTSIPVVARKNTPVVTVDPEILVEISRSFPGSRIFTKYILFQGDLEIFFPLSSGDLNSETKAEKLFSRAELEDLLSSNVLSWRGV